MAKTMRRIIIIAILLIVVGVGAMFAVMTFGEGTPFEGVRNDAINTLIDSSGVKQRIDSSLRQKASELAESTGVPVELLDYGIDALAVQDWKAASLPESATQDKRVDFEYDGTPIEVTTYDDPNYITVNAQGQTVTFQVPESAQTITSVLPYLDAADDAGIISALGSFAGVG